MRYYTLPAMVRRVCIWWESKCGHQSGFQQRLCLHTTTSNSGGIDNMILEKGKGFSYSTSLAGRWANAISLWDTWHEILNETFIYKHSLLFFSYSYIHVSYNDDHDDDNDDDDGKLLLW